MTRPLFKRLAIATAVGSLFLSLIYGAWEGITSGVAFFVFFSLVAVWSRRTGRDWFPD